MKRSTVEIWVGVFVLAGVAALVMLATRVGNLSTGGGMASYEVEARFDNIGGLTQKAPVTMAGVRVGRVTDIHIDRDDYSAVVVMAIEGQHDNLPKDTSAAILTAGLLGAQFVGLEAGGDDRFLKGGDEIKLTQSAIQLEQLIGQMIFGAASGDNKKDE